MKKKEAKPVARMIGRHIVTGPEICHGKPTFRGTRVMVADGLGRSRRDAASLARQAFLDPVQEYATPEYVLVSNNR
jgi:hypothetical protein